MNTKRILIIEDDIQIGNLEQEVLQQHGYACVRAYSGTEALLLLELAVFSAIDHDAGQQGGRRRSCASSVR